MIQSFPAQSLAEHTSGPELRQQELEHVQNTLLYFHERTEQGLHQLATQLAMQVAIANLFTVTCTANANQLLTPPITSEIQLARRKLASVCHALDSAETAMAAQRKRLEDEMRKQRLDTFKEHYTPELSMVLDDEQSDGGAMEGCPLCLGDAIGNCKMRCCARPICDSCAMQTSFFGTKCGTVAHTACPYCKSAYSVYAGQ